MLKRCLILTLFIMLSACGFHVHRDHLLTHQIPTLGLHSDSPNSQFNKVLITKLRRQGVDTEKANPPIELHLFKELTNVKLTGFDASHQAQIYLLSFSVIATLTNPDGDILAGPQSFMSQLKLTVEAGETLDSHNQQAIIVNEVHHDVAEQIINFLKTQQNQN